MNDLRGRPSVSFPSWPVAQWAGGSGMRRSQILNVEGSCLTRTGVFSYFIVVVFFYTSTVSHLSFCQISSLSTHLTTTNKLTSLRYFRHAVRRTDRSVRSMGYLAGSVVRLSAFWSLPLVQHYGQIFRSQHGSSGLFERWTDRCRQSFLSHVAGFDYRTVRI